MPGIETLRGSAQIFWEVALESYIVRAEWIRSERCIVVGTIEGEIAIVDVPTGSLRARWKAHAFGLSSIALSPDGSRIVSCGQDSILRIWNVSDATPAAAYVLPDRWGTGAAYSPSGRLIAAAAGKHLVLLSSEGCLVRDLGLQESTISDLAWAPSSSAERFASTGYGGVTLWPSNSSTPRRFKWKGSSLVLAWSPNGQYIATGDQDCTVHFWIVERGEDLEMSGYPLKVKELAWSGDSRYLATGGGDVVTIWDCSGKGPAGTEPISLEGHEEKIGAIAFQPDSNLLASGDEAGRVIIWSIDSDASGTSIDVAGAVSSLVWSNNGLLAAGTAAGVLYCAGMRT